jgi:hypothetical protein
MKNRTISVVKLQGHDYHTKCCCEKPWQKDEEVRYISVTMVTFYHGYSLAWFLLIMATFYHGDCGQFLVKTLVIGHIIVTSYTSANAAAVIQLMHMGRQLFH